MRAFKADSVLIALMLALFVFPTSAQTFTHADSLRGSNGPGRAWWDVTFYDLKVAVSPSDSSLSGSVAISYRTLAPSGEMQLDLQPPMQLLSVSYGGDSRPMRRDGNAWFVDMPRQGPGEEHTVVARFEGTPRLAVRPPWDGGYQWETDAGGNPWVATSNQGLGASIWWPNKDYQADEPDSQRVAITVPESLTAVSNGRLESQESNGDGTTTFTWFVSNPINNYSIEVNAGDYAHWSETFEGEDGPLSMDFWPLSDNLEKARDQWTQARTTIECFEHWFGPYPFYEDGYKLIEVPYLGMEHQSGVTYGNQYANGYLGRDLSGTGHGLLWDFIIVHESAHEWWGNNITASDIAENWVHESFANYSENLYTECLTGSKQKGEEYVIGTRAGISNATPIVAPYGVNQSGPGDMYNKGGNLLHTIRRLVDDDEQWRAVLRGLNAEFRHRIVPGTAVEAYITRETGLNLDRVWDQYLRTTMIPVLEWYAEDGVLGYRWQNVVHGFEMPVLVDVGGQDRWLSPTTSWQLLDAVGEESVDVDPGFYIDVRERQ
jgi:aminopeptidase N